MFRSTGANAFAKNQTRLAYEDKRDLYCIATQFLQFSVKYLLGTPGFFFFFFYSSAAKVSG